MYGTLPVLARFRSIGVTALIVAMAAMPLRRVAAETEASTIKVADAQLTTMNSYEIAATRAGLVKALNVKEGDRVRQGQVLVELLDDRAKMDVEHAALELSVAEFKAQDDVEVRHAVKAHALAEKELKRALEINAKIANSVPKGEVDRLTLAEERAKLAIESAEHQLQAAKMEVSLKALEQRIAQHNLDEHRLIAPVNALVVEISKRRGEWVESGKPILRVVEIDRVRAEGFVAVDQAALGLSGRLATLRLQAPDGKATILQGTVTFVSPEANPLNRTVRIWAEFDRRSLPLWPGLTGELEIGDEQAPKKADEAKLSQIQGQP